MYRRYYRYNDPTPSAPMKKPSPPAPQTTPKTASFLDFAQKDDLILIGLLGMLLLGEDKAEIDFPLVLALVYLLLQK